MTKIFEWLADRLLGKQLDRLARVMGGRRYGGYD